MSPLSSNTIVIGIGVEELAIGARPSRLRGLWRSLRSRRPRGPADGEPADGEAIGATRVEYGEARCFSAPAMVEALAQALARRCAAVDAGDDGDDAVAVPRAPGLGSAVDAHIVLDDFWAHHAVLLGDFRTLGAREVVEAARIHFADTFGSEDDALQVRAVLQPGGKALFATAMAGSLADGIRQACADAHVRIRSLTVGLPQLLNRIGRRLGAERAMLVVVTPPQLHALSMDGGRWVAYDTQRLFAGEADDTARIAALAGQLFERSSNVGREDCPVYLYGADAGAGWSAQRFGAVQCLGGPAAGRSAARCLAELAS